MNSGVLVFVGIAAKGHLYGVGIHTAAKDMHELGGAAGADQVLADRLKIPDLAARLFHGFAARDGFNILPILNHSGRGFKLPGVTT